MRFKKFLGVVVVVGGFLTACGSANFTGSGGNKGTNTPSQPSIPSTTNPNATNPTGTTTTPATPQGPGVPGTPGYNPIPGSPNYPGSVPNQDGQCPNGPCQPNQVPQIGPNSEIQVNGPNNITFGKDHVFHIGNGQFQNTSCKAAVSMLPLSGAVYFFQFEVLADNTSVDINVARTCGVDYNSGVVQLASNGVQLKVNGIPRGATSSGLSGAVLNRGVYTVYVYAGKGDDVLGPSWDVDDFIVGNVQINANQGIKAGQFGTYR